MSKETNTEEPKDNQQKEIHWEEVATTAGIAQAQIIVGRLQTEGIPARAWQESVGQSTGMIFGSLGMGHVLVPEEYFDQALDILDNVDEIIDEEDDDQWDD